MKKLKDYITSFATFTGIKEREDCTITLDKQVDIAFTMVTEIEGTKKADIVHDLLRDYVNKHTADTTIETLSEYSQRQKKTDPQAQQFARMVIPEKVMEMYSKPKEVVENV